MDNTGVCSLGMSDSYSEWLETWCKKPWESVKLLQLPILESLRHYFLQRSQGWMDADMKPVLKVVACKILLKYCRYIDQWLVTFSNIILEKKINLYQWLLNKLFTFAWRSNDLPFPTVWIAILKKTGLQLTHVITFCTIQMKTWMNKNLNAECRRLTSGFASSIHPSS